MINWKFLYLQNGEKYILKCMRQADIFTHLSGPRTVNLTEEGTKHMSYLMQGNTLLKALL